MEFSRAASVVNALLTLGLDGTSRRREKRRVAGGIAATDKYYIGKLARVKGRREGRRVRRRFV